MKRARILKPSQVRVTGVFLSSCALCIFPATAWCQDTLPLKSEVGRRLAGEQESLKEEVREVRRRLIKLAQELEESEPEDAKQLRKAAQKIDSTDLDRTLDDIRKFLNERSFLEALTREEKAIEHYTRAMSLGGSRPLPELFEAAGLTFDFGPGIVSRLIDEVQQELDALPV